jgi:hypothetical protein
MDDQGGEEAEEPTSGAGVLTVERLLQSGLRELRAACGLLRNNPSPMDARRALREVGTGIELVMKSFLAAADWKQIFKNPKKASAEEFHQGTFTSVGFMECIDRLKSLTSVHFTEQQTKEIELMRSRRNRLEHLGQFDNVTAVRSAIGGSLDAIASLTKQAAEMGLLDGTDGELHTTLAIELSGLDEFVAARWKEIREGLSVESAAPCPGCGQNAAVLDATWTCRFCGTESDAKDVAEYFIESELGLVAYSVVKDGGQWPLYDCPECEDEALVGLDEGGFRCFACGEDFESGVLSQCTDCDRPIVDHGPPTVCTGCFRNRLDDD